MQRRITRTVSRTAALAACALVLGSCDTAFPEGILPPTGRDCTPVHGLILTVAIGAMVLVLTRRRGMSTRTA
jgi:hypothetical protein